MVWYQQFEYAVGHWLQKATEHVFGCVLCCPGCFSLFRASALVDDNVLKTYTREPTEGTHLIQFEQGEDRWLCTLLLKCGYKIDYCAGADAKTFAPEGFFEFFIQRRRWSPSTLANMIDLVLSWRELVKSNNQINHLFMFYQCVMVGTSLLAPATVITLISGSFSTVLKIGPWWAFFLSLVPVFAFGISCFTCKQEKQLLFAGILSTCYTFVMVIVTIGMILSLINEPIASPNPLFLGFVASTFVLAGIIHPKELTCLFAGLLYYVTVPSTFIFLTVYFVCNLNDVSWGTREKKSVETKVKKEKSFLMLVKDMLIHFMKDKLPDKVVDVPAPLAQRQESVPTEVMHSVIIGSGNEEFWTKQLPDYTIKKLDCIETKFWVETIDKSLKPLQNNMKLQEKFRTELVDLRNKCVFGFLMMNLLLALVLQQLQVSREQLKKFYIVGKYEPVQIIFLGIFAALLIVQLFGMLKHRWGTFLHLISSTDLDSLVQEKIDITANDVLGYDKEMHVVYDEPKPDYDVDYGEESDASVNSGSNLYRRYVAKTMRRQPPSIPHRRPSFRQMLGTIRERFPTALRFNHNSFEGRRNFQNQAYLN